MLFDYDIFILIAAGIMNGSFVIPARYIKTINNEWIWIYHSIIGLIIIPWALLILTPLSNSIYNYSNLSSNIFLFLIFSGIIFGLGQICFAYAIESIGIALSFTINLGMGLTIGSMFVVFYKAAFFTLQGYFVTLSVSLILLSLIIYYYTSRNKKYPNENISYHRGWLLASITGLTSGLQNIAFIITAFHYKAPSGNTFWVWPPFLLAAAIPMLIGFLYRAKQKAPQKNNKIPSLKNLILIFLMGLFFTGSLALYSNGMNQLSNQERIIGWPTFIVSIILASQIWGWLYQRNNRFKLKSTLYNFASLALLILAIIILALQA